MKNLAMRIAKYAKELAFFIYDYFASSFNDGHTSRRTSYILMRRFYSLSRGVSSSVLACLPLLMHPSRSRASPAISIAVQALKRHGFYNIYYPDSVVQALCESLRSELSAYPIYEVSQNMSQGHEYASIHFALDDPCRSSVRLNHHRKDVARCIYAWRIIKELQMADIADLYLGCDPILTSIDSWYVVPKKETENSAEVYSAAAQTFHYDMDWIRFIKFFVNLTDVDECHGPFEFISDSHNIKSDSLYQDGRFENLFPGKGLVKATGPAGSLFVADTSGIHRDGRAVSGFRQVLQVEFAVSSFGAKFQYDSMFRECSNSMPWSNLPGELTSRKRMLRLFGGV